MIPHKVSDSEYKSIQCNDFMNWRIKQQLALREKQSKVSAFESKCRACDAPFYAVFG